MLSLGGLGKKNLFLLLCKGWGELPGPRLVKKSRKSGLALEGPRTPFPHQSREQKRGVPGLGGSPQPRTFFLSGFAALGPGLARWHPSRLPPRLPGIGGCYPSPRPPPEGSRAAAPCRAAPGRIPPPPALRRNGPPAEAGTKPGAVKGPARGWRRQRRRRAARLPPPRTTWPQMHGRQLAAAARA